MWFYIHISLSEQVGYCLSHVKILSFKIPLNIKHKHSITCQQTISQYINNQADNCTSQSHFKNCTTCKADDFWIFIYRPTGMFPVRNERMFTYESVPLPRIRV